MTIQQFIEKAIEGGWSYRGSMHWRESADEIIFNNAGSRHEHFTNKYEILLDPEAWKAVGKVEGWDDYHLPARSWTMKDSENAITLLDSWECKMHDLIQALAEGNTIQQYLATL